MRELSFSKKWDKLSQGFTFTTFRFPRKDKDWHTGETVRIVYKARTKQREILGTAVILTSKQKYISQITHEEAAADGFPGGWLEMWLWFKSNNHKRRDLLFYNPINKLTLVWLPRNGS